MLFGHQNDDVNQSAQAAAVTPTAGVNPLAVDPDTGASLPVAPAEPPMPPDPSEPSVLNQPAASFTSAPETNTSATDLASPTDPFMPASAPVVLPQTEDASASTSTAADQPATTDTPTSAPAEPASAWAPRQEEPANIAPTGALSGGLLSLKQQALAQLEPLVDQLDQTPEEKFRTTMMLIQSTDNQALIQDAYDTAQSITDEKIRAQALLDVINEINYFTQQSPKE